MADDSKRSMLAQVPFEGVCPAEVTTFLGLKLECESDPADHHGILHYDVDQGIWWIHDDEMFELARKAGATRYYELPSVVNPVAAAVAAERERICKLADDVGARYLDGGDWSVSAKLSDLIRRLADA